MKNFSYKYLFLIIALLAVFFVFFRFYQQWSFPDTAWQLAKGEKTDIESKKPLQQKFIASRDNLSRIDIFLSSSSIKPGGTLKMAILDEACANILRTETWKVKDLDSEDSYSFRFAKIPESKNKTYCFSLVYTPLLENGKKAKIFLNENPPAGSELILTTQEIIDSRSLAIRPAYQNDNLAGNIRELNQRISQYKPWFLKSIFLNIIVFSFLLLSFALVTILILL